MFAKGSKRIGKVVEKIKTDIVELEKGIGEVDDEIDSNNQRVETKREELSKIEAEVASSNRTLQTAKEMASSLKGNLQGVLGF